MSTPSSRGVRFTCVAVTLVCLVLGGVAGVFVTAVRLTGKPQVFRSMAKVTVAAGGPAAPGSTAVMETFESSELTRRAHERVLALHPELKKRDMSVITRQAKDSGIIYILASGPEPKYTQLFLNALLDEFRVSSDSAAVQERATTSAEHVEDWKMPMILGGAAGAAVGLIAGVLLSLLATTLSRSNGPPAIGA
ncbi:MAG: hypothetical protein U1F81_12825 [Verrucomicrobiaceae bacterium]